MTKINQSAVALAFNLTEHTPPALEEGIGPPVLP